MISKVEVIEHPDDIVKSIPVLLPQVLQDPHFHQGLSMEPLLIPDQKMKPFHNSVLSRITLPHPLSKKKSAFPVPDYFDGDLLPRLVIVGSNHLPETPPSNHLQYLVAVRQVIVQDLRGAE